MRAPRNTPLCGGGRGRLNANPRRDGPPARAAGAPLKRASAYLPGAAGMGRETLPLYARERSRYTPASAPGGAAPSARLGGHSPYARTTGFDRVPIPSIVISTRSPALTGPHPGGAPVMTTSPGSRVNAVEA